MSLAPGWTLRQARVTDARGIAHVHVESWQEAYVGLVDPEYLAKLETEERASGWEARLVAGRGADLLLRPWWGGARPARTEVLVNEAGEIQGFVSYGPLRDVSPTPGRAREGELYALYVHPRAWGSGGGWALYCACLAALRRAGFEQVTIWTMRGAAQARAFYERQGADLCDQARVERTQGLVMDLVRYRVPTPASARFPWSQTLRSLALRGALALTYLLCSSLGSQGVPLSDLVLAAGALVPLSLLEGWRETRRGASDLATAGLGGALLAGAASLLPAQGQAAPLLALLGAASAAALGPLSGEGKVRTLLALVLAALGPGSLWLAKVGCEGEGLLGALGVAAGGALLRFLFRSAPFHRPERGRGEMRA